MVFCSVVKFSVRVFKRNVEFVGLIIVVLGGKVVLIETDVSVKNVVFGVTVVVMLVNSEVVFGCVVL